MSGIQFKKYQTSEEGGKYNPQLGEKSINKKDPELIQMTELEYENVKTAIKNMLHIFKKVEGIISK